MPLNVRYGESIELRTEDGAVYKIKYRPIGSEPLSTDVCTCKLPLLGEVIIEGEDLEKAEKIRDALAELLNLRPVSTGS